MTSETPDQRELRFEELLRESARAAADYDASEEEIDHGAAQELSERQALRRVKGFSTQLQDISEAEYRELQAHAPLQTADRRRRLHCAHI